MARMILVTGFARGGTSWLRSCIAEHPDVQAIPHEMPVFKGFLDDPEGLRGCYAQAIADNGLHGPYFVNKAPANAPYVGRVARLFPEAKFLFIVRDPRDVLVSHQRGNQAWMRGANSTVEGCMSKLKRYYAGYDPGLANVMLVRYEDLHQAFVDTMRKVFSFIGLAADDALLGHIYKRRNFAAVAGRVKEDRDAAARKGVIGDWSVHLSEADISWYHRNDYWRRFLDDNGYGWTSVTYERLLQALRSAGIRSLTVNELFKQTEPIHGKAVLLLHDVDLLRTTRSQQGVKEAARLEREYGFGSVFNFLPLDDPRYEGVSAEQILRLMHELRESNPHIEIGLHLNATEPFFPADMADQPADHPLIAKAIAYLHEQIDAYAAHGIRFRLSTAHGYGRGKKRPNNRDTPVFTAELERRGVTLFDTTIGKFLKRRAVRYVRMNDVGGILHVRGLDGAAAVDAPLTYARLPEGTIIEILTHPGNFDPKGPLPLGMRMPLTQRKPATTRAA